MAAAKQKAKKIWDNYKVVGEVQKSEAIKLVIAAAYRDGVQYINVREFYIRKGDQTWMPGRDGITIPVIIPVKAGTEMVQTSKIFKALLEQAEQTLKDLPMEDDANAVWNRPKEDK